MIKRHLHTYCHPNVQKHELCNGYADSEEVWGFYCQCECHNVPEKEPWINPYCKYGNKVHHKCPGVYVSPFESSYRSKNCMCNCHQPVDSLATHAVVTQTGEIIQKLPTWFPHAGTRSSRRLKRVPRLTGKLHPKNIRPTDRIKL